MNHLFRHDSNVLMLKLGPISGTEIDIVQPGPTYTELPMVELPDKRVLETIRDCLPTETECPIWTWLSIWVWIWIWIWMWM